MGLRIRLILPAVILLAAVDVYAAGLNTDVALTPPLGGTIVRAQWRYVEMSGDNIKVKLNINPVTIVYGVTEKFAILGTVAPVDRRIDFASGFDVDDAGVGDIPLLAKYRFYQHDQPGVTTRWAALGGLEIPTYDAAFSSDSFDPILGTVWTHQRRDWWLDWDVLYKFNTGDGINGDDELRGDTAISYRLFGADSGLIGPWGLYAIGEINAKYIADGSLQVLGSPGLQWIAPRWIVETGVQLPIYQDMQGPRLETDFTVVLSVRFQF